MSTPYYIILSDSEDEQNDIPVTIILSDSEDESSPPLSFEDLSEEGDEYVNEDTPSHPSQYAAAEEEEEEEVEGPAEEEEEDEDEEEGAEEEPGIQSSNPATSPTPLPAYDPYDIPFPHSSSTQRRSDCRHWDWIPDTIDSWRAQEGSPFPNIIKNPPILQRFPITGEPTHHTIPLMIARLTRHETQIEHLESNVETLSGPEHIEELQQDVWTLEHHFQNLHDRTEEIAGRVAQDPNRLREIERRLDGLERSLEQFHTLADTMGGYANFILRGDQAFRKNH